MRIKKGLIIQQIDNQYYVIDSGDEAPKFNGMITLNETSYFILKKLQENTLTLDELYSAFLDEYNTSIEELKEHIPPVLKQFRDLKIIIE